MTTTTTTTIDCDGCPVRGRHCADCFVPVLGRRWLDAPQVPGRANGGGLQAEPLAPIPEELAEPAGPTAALDSDELAAVATFVRCGLLDPSDATGLRAEVRVLPGRAVAG